MQKITFEQLESIMLKFNKENPDKQDTAVLHGVIVFKASNWSRPYNETQRSYEVTNANRAFQEGKISNALSGSCLDGTDIGVRLDWYKWEVEYCYMKE